MRAIKKNLNSILKDQPDTRNTFRQFCGLSAYSVIHRRSLGRIYGKVQQPTPEDGKINSFRSIKRVGQVSSE